MQATKAHDMFSVPNISTKIGNPLFRDPHMTPSRVYVTCSAHLFWANHFTHKV